MKNTLGSRMHAARHVCGFTLAQVAYATGIAPADLAWMEMGGLYCPTWLVQTLAALYGVNVGRILLHPALLEFVEEATS